MGEIKKVGDTYYIEFYARGLPYQRIAGESKEEAIRLLEQIEQQIREGEEKVFVRKELIDDFAAEFVLYAEKEYSSLSNGYYQSAFRYFYHYLKEQLFSEDAEIKMHAVTPKVMEEYKAFLKHTAKQSTPPIKAHILNVNLFLLKDIFSFAINKGYVNDNPLTHVSFFSVEKNLNPQYVTDQQFAELLQNTDEKGKAIFKLAFAVGLRKSEIVALSWDDIDFNARLLSIERNRNKRSLPMDLDLLESMKHVYETQSSDGPVFADGHALFEDKHTNMLISLRNTFAKRMLEKGLSAIQLSQVLGFDNILRIFYYL